MTTSEQLLIEAVRLLHEVTDDGPDEQSWSQINDSNRAYDFIRALPLDLRRRCGDGYPWLTVEEQQDMAQMGSSDV